MEVNKQFKQPIRRQYIRKKNKQRKQTNNIYKNDRL